MTDPSLLPPEPALAPPAPPPAPPWRLLRSRQRVLGGVCRGIATATGIDVTLVRLAAVAAAVGGVGVVAYGALWLLVPREDPARGLVSGPAPDDTARWLRVGVVGAAVVGLSNVFGAGWWGLGPRRGDGGFFIGLVLLAIGGIVLWRRRRSVAAAAPPPAPAGVAGAGGAPPAPPAWWAPPTPPEPAGPEPRRGSDGLLAVRVVTWLLVLATAAVSLVVAAAVHVGALTLPAPWLYATAAAVVVVGLAVAAVVVRPASRLALCLLAVPALGVATLATARFDGAVGERVVRPATLDAVADSYRMAAGHLVVDLSGLQPGETPLRVAVDQSVGRLDVVVPEGSTTRYRIRADAGEARAFGRQQDGWRVDLDGTAGTGGTVVELDLDMGYGAVYVCNPAGVRDLGRNVPSCR